MAVAEKTVRGRPGTYQEADLHHALHPGAKRHHRALLPESEGRVRLAASVPELPDGSSRDGRGDPLVPHQALGYRSPREHRAQQGQLVTSFRGEHYMATDGYAFLQAAEGRRHRQWGRRSGGRDGTPRGPRLTTRCPAQRPEPHGPAAKCARSLCQTSSAKGPLHGFARAQRFGLPLAAFSCDLRICSTTGSGDGIAHLAVRSPSGHIPGMNCSAARRR